MHSNCEADIALLELKKVIDDVQPIKILSATDESKLLNKEKYLYAWGWGETEHHKISENLKNVSLPVVGYKECLDRYKPFGYNVTKNMICAGYKDGNKNIYVGDSGGH